MALNLSTLTSPATSGDVLAEVLTTADFLEPVPVLRNLARGSQKGGDAKQGTALNQPKALPLIKNPAGNLGGYLYIPDVSGNSATGPSVTIGANQTWEAEVDMVITEYGNYIKPLGGGAWTSGFSLLIYSDGRARVFSKSDVSNLSAVNSIPLNTPFNVKYGFNGSAIYIELNDQSLITTSTGSNQASVLTEDLKLQAQPSSLGSQGNYAIQKAKLTVNSSVVFDCDFNGSTSIRHGDTKWQAAVGGPVTLTRAGNDPATIIKKPVLRFDGTNDGLNGLFANNINGGYMFAAFSVLGAGGVNDGRVFSVNANGAGDIASSGFVYGLKYGGNNDLAAYGAGAYRWAHNDMYDDDRGDILYEAKAKSGGLISKVNNANKFQPTTTLAIASNEFNVGNGILGVGRPVAIDLEFLALFPSSITDAQADDVRNYINNRNNVFSLIDSQGYYFFDPQKATFTGNFTNFGGGNRLDGYITGSDNGDTDVRSNLTLIQETGNDQPSTDGYTITFHDNAEHLGFKNGVSQNLSGWQIVGTSLGTFAYRVQGAVSELNLLGNLGSASYRKAGDLYGVILLPESATGKDIEDARKLLIDRGAADAANTTTFENYWRDRGDIVEFQFIATSTVTDFRFAWFNTRLTSFPFIDSSNVTDFFYAFYDTRLTSFPALDMSKGTNFANAWNSVSTLTSFPAGAKLGTEATNVNFDSAWRSSGLTSFSTPLPTGADVRSAWRNNTSLTDFSTDVFNNWNPTSIASGVFNNTWVGNPALTAQSVENILTSIDASGKYGTATGASGGGSIDSGIDIDYDGTTLSSVTDSAITSLRGKSWVVYINGVERIP